MYRYPEYKHYNYFYCGRFHGNHNGLGWGWGQFGTYDGSGHTEHGCYYESEISTSFRCIPLVYPDKMLIKEG